MNWWAGCRRASNRKRWSARSIRCCEAGPNYFCYGTYTPAFHVVHKHACRRVRRWLRRKLELDGQGVRQYPDSRLEREFGLLNLMRFPRRYSWAQS